MLAQPGKLSIPADGSAVHPCSCPVLWRAFRHIGIFTAKLAPSLGHDTSAVSALLPMLWAGALPHSVSGRAALAQSAASQRTYFAGYLLIAIF